MTVKLTDSLISENYVLTNDLHTLDHVMVTMSVYVATSYFEPMPKKGLPENMSFGHLKT